MNVFFVNIYFKICVNGRWPRSKNSLSLKLTKSGNYQDFFRIISPLIRTTRTHSNTKKSPFPLLDRSTK